MTGRRYLYTLLLAFVAIGAVAQVKVEPGVSQELAQYRAKHVRNVEYKLSFEIPKNQRYLVEFQEELSFDWDGNEDLQIDFQGKLLYARVSWRDIDSCYQNEHIVIPAKYLKKGRNRVRIGGCCSDKALNRQQDYLYTLFVPDHARSAFACFDQPDMKAKFTLSLTMPYNWTAISNGSIKKTKAPYSAMQCAFAPPRRKPKTEAEWRYIEENGQRKMTFQTTEPIPTYLFSYTAGRFSEQKAVRDGRELTALYRETDSAKVAQLPIIFDEIALSLKWLETYTGIPYPFEKYGFVLLPGYQFGGMEHPGCIQYKDNTLFLGPNPTPDEEMNRLHLLAHETAHMWFGDLVTMRWFNDVWTKEVFANFMADKIAREQYPDINHDLSFLRTHYIPSLATDRTEGTHPIQQPLANLNQAGLLYGNIIYHKAPIMMRKLEQQMGETAFQRGLQKYLKQFSYGNATWDELIEILNAEAPEAGIRDFDRKWVKQKGVPVRALDPFAETLPNADGMDYVRYELTSQEEIENYMGRIFDMPTEQSRLAAVMTLYENMLMHHVQPGDFMLATLYLASPEQNELLLSAYSNYLTGMLSYLTDEERPDGEEMLWMAAQTHPVKSFRQQLLRSLSRIAQSPEVADSIFAIWKEGKHPLLNERDYMQMAYHLAIVRPDDWQQIVSTQRERLTNADVKKEFDFVSRACTPDTLEQKRLFESLLQQENRAVEPYASALLSLLNDPTREPYNNRFITPGLEILEEIQRTGDIFFPLNWCQSLLGGHRSKEAADLVQAFLTGHPDYPEQLCNKLLQAADPLLKRHEMLNDKEKPYPCE